MTMGTDKLKITARAAGFAMACDDTATAPQAALPQQVILALPAPATQTAALPSTALAKLKQAKANIGWGMLGWSFGKTA